MQCRNISQDCVNERWKELCGKMEEEVLEKYRVEETKKVPGRCEESHKVAD